MQRVIIVSAFLITAVGMLTPGLAPPFGIPDTYAHTAAFLICSLTIIHFYPQYYHTSFLGMLSLAIIMELGQAFVPSRAFELIDISSNLIGVLLAYTLYPNLSEKFKL